MFCIVHETYSTKIAKIRDLSAEGACLIIAYLTEVQPILPTGTPVLKFTGISCLRHFPVRHDFYFSRPSQVLPALVLV